MNRIILSGNAGKDAELSTSKDGRDMARFSLAVARVGSRDRDKKDWFDCICFGKLAKEIVTKYVKKGTKLAIIGRIEFYEIEKEGKTIIRHAVMFDDFELIGAPSDKKEQPINDDDNTPF